MLARVQSYLLQGIDALPCEVEVDFVDMEGAESVPRPAVVGLPDVGVKESIERVRAAVTNSGYIWPWGRIVVNLAPADVRKEGPVYDLAIAVGLLLTQGVLATSPVARHAALNAPTLPGSVGVADSMGSLGADESESGTDGMGIDYRRYLFAGELALDGRVRPVKGVIALAALARLRGYRGVFVPRDNAQEASVVEGLEVLGVSTLSEVVGILRGAIEPSPVPMADVNAMLAAAEAPIDFVDVRGQEAVKRAITVAAAGGHNILRLCPSVRHGRRLPRQTEGHNLLRLCPTVGHGGGRGVARKRPARRPLRAIGRAVGRRGRERGRV